jgi:hypothetical protein
MSDWHRSRAVVLPGPSGSGKSTIFDDATAAGYAGLSEDLVWVREAPEGFRACALRRGSEPAMPPGTPEEARIGAVVLPFIRDRAMSVLRPLPAVEAVGGLLRQASMLGCGAVLASRFTSLVRLVASVPCRTLEAGRDRGSTLRMLAGLVTAPQPGPAPGTVGRPGSESGVARAAPGPDHAGAAPGRRDRM